MVYGSCSHETFCSDLAAIKRVKFDFAAMEHYVDLPAISVFFTLNIARRIRSSINHASTCSNVFFLERCITVIEMADLTWSDLVWSDLT